MATISTRRGNVAVLRLNNPPLNVLSFATRSSLAKELREAERDPSVRSIVLMGSNRAFCAGADITEFRSPEIDAKEPKIRQLMGIMEGASKPLVAVITGVALGGGMELALSCHYRLVHKTARMGLPEVNIGLLPGACGTQKLPRVTSVANAVDVITSGRHLSAKEALEMGIADKILNGDPLEEGIAFAKSVADAPVAPRRVSQMPVKMDQNTPAVLKAAYEKVAARSRGQYSPLMIVRAIEAATKAKTFEEGFKMEKYYQDFLSFSDQAKALQYAFFSERAVSKWKLPDGSASYKTARGQPVRSAAVIGAGTMGSGITMSLISTGIPTYLTEQSQEFLDKGLKLIRGYLASAVKRGRLDQQRAEQVFSLVRPTLNYGDLRDVDLVIEAVYENMAVKKEIFKKLDAACKPGAVLASNTSFLDIDQMASVTSRPDKVIGMHFFAPAHVMKLLENIRGKNTSPETMATAMDMGKRLNKTSVLVGNCFGFVANRMGAQYSEETSFLVLEGALPHEVDLVLEDFGFSMGKFRVTDLSGIDIGYRLRKGRGLIQREGQQDLVRQGRRYNPLPDWLVEKGRLGQKTGKGYYNYGKPGGRKAEVDPEVTELILDLSQKCGLTRKHISSQEILERSLYCLINEGFKCLEEGIASSEQDIDMIWLKGMGWPRHTGGPMFYARHIVGLPKVYERITFYHIAYPDVAHWKPSQLLESTAIKMIIESFMASRL